MFGYRISLLLITFRLYSANMTQDTPFTWLKESIVIKGFLQPLEVAVARGEKERITKKITIISTHIEDGLRLRDALDPGHEETDALWFETIQENIQSLRDAVRSNLVQIRKDESDSDDNYRGGSPLSPVPIGGPSTFGGAVVLKEPKARRSTPSGPGPSKFGYTVREIPPRAA